MAAEAEALNPFRRRQSEPKMDAKTTHAEIRLEELRARVRALENVKTVVSIKTRPAKQQ